jgi:hypothetical protein
MFNHVDADRTLGVSGDYFTHVREIDTPPGINPQTVATLRVASSHSHNAKAVCEKRAQRFVEVWNQLADEEDAQYNPELKTLILLMNELAKEGFKLDRVQDLADDILNLSLFPYKSLLVDITQHCRCTGEAVTVVFGRDGENWFELQWNEELRRLQIVNSDYDSWLFNTIVQKHQAKDVKLVWTL